MLNHDFLAAAHRDARRQPRPHHGYTMVRIELGKHNLTLT